MRLFDYPRGDRAAVLGILLFVALTVAGCYYNLTFVQLGLIDLGTRLVGMSETTVSTWMAALALCTLVVAVGTGVTMDSRGWSRDLRTKLRPLFGVVVVQFALTLVAPLIRTVPAFGIWIVLASIGLGVLAATALLVLFVYMAFTLILIPDSIAGLIGELLVVLYGQLVFGYLIGRRLPIERIARATVAGIGVFLVLLELLSMIPYLGSFIQVDV